MKKIKTFEKYVKPFRKKRKSGPQPKFNKGDEVMVMYDLMQYGRPYFGIKKGDIVTIRDYWIYANDTIEYKIDSPKLREIGKEYEIENDLFDEFYFAYEWEEDANKYNL